MDELISLKSYPIHNTLRILLQDKTTKKNIIWATNSYELQLGNDYDDKKQITIGALTGLNPIELQPRILKNQEEQKKRTRIKAEVFTPAWICNKMNNYCDEDWFERKDVFNTEHDQSWETNPKKIEFNKPNGWKKYVDSRRLEITCGEAPFLVSRYDASTGKFIFVKDRIGILDRKLRIVNENTSDRNEWLKWIYRAFQSVYGYEFQGDNLLIGRINLLMTFVEYYQDRWNEQPTVEELKKVANIISWNLWQMDGLTGRVPLGDPKEEIIQPTLFDLLEDNGEQEELELVGPKCKIYDWRKDNSVLYESLKGGI